MIWSFVAVFDWARYYRWEIRWKRSRFADPQQQYHEAVQFYKNDVDWANRLILGDSLLVMASLSHREDLAGKVQMIYMDPPYASSLPAARSAHH